MRYMSGDEIRKLWLKFFKEKGHKIEESASLIPLDDKSLLWINAGITPLKKYFDGTLVPPSKRIANVQKCLRTNDIENVGLTARHHTFFEMLGNFSIGDYFKEEAIKMGFELLTSKKYFNMPLDKLYMTYYPTDIEAKNVWLKLGVKESHIIAHESNYWEIGEGPSGPDTEIFFDRGSKFDQRGIELIANDIENDRFIEIWNIVFSQYNAKAGLKREEYEELPSKNIDTGAGLERFACILQNTETNFETDLFFPIILKIEEIAQVKYNNNPSFRIIADHIKTLVMAISDGAVLSNEGRGYVLRRLLRRALKHGKKLGIKGEFLTKLIPAVENIMASEYPNVSENKAFVKKIIASEEKKFLQTLTVGETLIEKIIKEKGSLSKNDSFLLFDTYGFPIELQEEYAFEHQIKIDKAGFYELLEGQKQLSRKHRKDEVSMKTQDDRFLAFKEKSDFVGDETLEIKSEVIAVFDEGIVVKKTPFYATKGGQEKDEGLIDDVKVLDVITLPNGQHLHKVNHQFSKGQIVNLKVDENVRLNIKRNHTATHLLHQALKDVLGTHVNQQGSLVAKDLLRFDFNHYQFPTDEEVLKIETIVKGQIKEGIPVLVNIMPIKEALKLGAIALFGEKYGDLVRVVEVKDKSVELCGGTHVENTKEIQDFLIAGISSIGSGIYRIEAFSGPLYKKLFQKRNSGIIQELNSLITKYQNLLLEAKAQNIKGIKRFVFDYDLVGSYQDLINLRVLVDSVKENNKTLERKIKLAEEKALLLNKDDLIKKKKNNLITTKDLPANVLRGLFFELYDKIKSEILLIINISDDKITYMVKTRQKGAKEILDKLNQVSGGSGGGRDDFATGGTSDLSKYDALVKVMERI